MCDCSVYHGKRVQVWSIIWETISKKSAMNLVELSSISGNISFLHPTRYLFRSLSRTLQWRWSSVNHISENVPIQNICMVQSRGTNLTILQLQQTYLHLYVFTHFFPGISLPQCSLVSLQSLNSTHSSKTSIDLAPSGSSPEYCNPTCPSSQQVNFVYNTQNLKPSCTFYYWFFHVYSSYHLDRLQPPNSK